MSVVLVVDDDDDTLRALGEVLSDAGWTVFIAGSAAEAREIVRSQWIDVVLADLMMPHQDGRALHASLPAGPAGPVPFVLMTASAESAPKLDGIPVLAKPFDMRKVLAVLNACVS
jgi:DNA-binding response OmpR family regulator